MSMKDKIKSILFGTRTEDTVDEEPRAQQEPVEAEASSAAEFIQEDPALIKLPGDHHLYQLYNLRRKESGYLPAPRLCLDEDGVLPRSWFRGRKTGCKGLCGACAAFG